MNENIVLRAVQALKENAYGFMIRQEILRSGLDLSLGSIYVALEKLERGGFVTFRRGELTAERGGRQKLYVSLTPSGLARVEAKQ